MFDLVLLLPFTEGFDMLRLACVLSSLASCHALSVGFAQTADQPVRLSAEVTAGILADSDVGLADLDQTTRKGDIALRIGARVNAEAKPAKKLTLRAGYDFKATQYQDFSDFDLQTHLVTAESAYAFGKTDAGVLIAYADARLDGESYLTLNQVSPFVQHTFGDHFVLRGAYLRSERDFEAEDGRDATGNELTADSFILLDGTRRYFVVGASAGESEANDPQFSYSGGGGKLRYINRFDLFGTEAKLRLGGEFELREFDEAPAGFTEPRQDELLAGTGDLSIPIRGPVSLDLGYEYRARESNLQPADYDEHVGRAELKLAF